MVRGNNEQYILDSYKNKSKSKWYLQLKAEIAKHDMPISEMAEWIESTPLKWETPHILITHAGIAKGEKNPFYISNLKSVLNNRSPLKNIGKIQVHGHDMIKTGKAEYNKISHSWNIDTGVWSGNALTGVKLNRKGKLIDVIEVPTHPLDTIPTSEFDQIREQKLATNLAEK